MKSSFTEAQVLNGVQAAINALPADVDFIDSIDVIPYITGVPYTPNYGTPVWLAPNGDIGIDIHYVARKYYLMKRVKQVRRKVGNSTTTNTRYRLNIKDRIDDKNNSNDN